MYVCVCNAVNERRIREAADTGVVNLRELTRALRVGTRCGKCVPQARAILDQALAGRPVARGASAA